MRTDSLTEAAIHLTLVLAVLPAGAVLPSAELAAFHALSPTAVAKLMRKLASADVVVAQPGRVGGYGLSRSPRDITILSIVEAIDGAAPVFHCREIRRNGVCAAPKKAFSAKCAVARLMDGATLAWRRELAGTTLADLSATVRSELSPGVSKLASQWMHINAR